MTGFGPFIFDFLLQTQHFNPNDCHIKTPVCFFLLFFFFFKKCSLYLLFVYIGMFNSFN